MLSLLYHLVANTKFQTALMAAATPATARALAEAMSVTLVAPTATVARKACTAVFSALTSMSFARKVFIFYSC